MVSICINNDGYLIVCSNSKHFLLNRLILEFKLDRKLKSNEIAHHIDGNKLNNDPNNLESKTRSRHQTYHQLLRGLKSTKGICPSCGGKKSYGSHRKLCKKCWAKNNCGTNNSMFGKQHSKETRDKQSKIRSEYYKTHKHYTKINRGDTL